MPLLIKDLKASLFARFPLVEFVFSQNTVQLTRRPIDMAWYYKRVVPISVSGFNPLRQQIFYGRNSYLEKFIREDAEAIHGSDVDWFLYEIFFAVHDYIHIWSVTTLLPFFPGCVEQTVLEDSESADDLAFIILMSEVAAVVALDYWMLASANLADELSCAVKFRCLTTPFCQNDLDAARLINPNFETRCITFFHWLAKGYFDDTFVGFYNADDSVVGKLAPWLLKEKRVGRAQRGLIKAWVSYLKSLKGSLTNEVTLDWASPRRVAATEALSSELWRAFGARRPSALPIVSLPTVPLPTTFLQTDFRFVNISSVDIDLAKFDFSKLSVKQFGYFAAQFVSLFNFDDYSGFGANIFDEIVSKQRSSALFEVFGKVRPMRSYNKELVHLFLPN